MSNTRSPLGGLKIGILILPVVLLILASTGNLTWSSGTLSLAVAGKPMLKSTISTLRVKDARASEAFYRDKLGFNTTWEHDPGDGYPVFVEIKRDAVAFHLSEHEGDGPNGVSIYVNVADAVALHDELAAREVPIASAPEAMPWGETVFTIEDPDGNKLRFGSPT